MEADYIPDMPIEPENPAFPIVFLSTVLLQQMAKSISKTLLPISMKKCVGESPNDPTANDRIASQ